jgi:hypothetical protein
MTMNFALLDPLYSACGQCGNARLKQHDQTARPREWVRARAEVAFNATPEMT